MRIIIQRTNEAEVKVNNKIVGKIDKGLVLLVGFTIDDCIQDIEYMIDKIINLRIFDDENNKMNLSLKDVNGSILSISQFTLYADSNKGRRPSFDKALSYIEAEKLYSIFNIKLKESNINVQTGIYGENMKVKLINDGPVTIIIDSKNK